MIIKLIINIYYKRYTDDKQKFVLTHMLIIMKCGTLIFLNNSIKSSHLPFMLDPKPDSEYTPDPNTDPE